MLRVVRCSLLLRMFEVRSRDDRIAALLGRAESYFEISVAQGLSPGWTLHRAYSGSQTRMFGPPAADRPRISCKRSGCRTGRILGSLPNVRRARCPPMKPATDLSPPLSRAIRTQVAGNLASPVRPDNRPQTRPRRATTVSRRLANLLSLNERNAAGNAPRPVKRERRASRRHAGALTRRQIRRVP